MLAERDYEIRNRTVHTKEGFDELGPLLPFNPEVETPDHDTALVRFLAQETLAVSARPLERLRQRRQVSPCRVETHRSGSSTQPPKRLTGEVSAVRYGGPLTLLLDTRIATLYFGMTVVH